ncbi:hypothetical protein [Microbacterium sp. NPDC076895]|uniref:hypothetical protein n=1 Tax=Microbacterium sp. NPDC076895 TaxID=3154957 RepID=UPI0034163602
MSFMISMIPMVVSASTTSPGSTKGGAPGAGRHDSGLGVEYGIEGLHAYLTYQSVHRRVR